MQYSLSLHFHTDFLSQFIAHTLYANCWEITSMLPLFFSVLLPYVLMSLLYFIIHSFQYDREFFKGRDGAFNLCFSVIMPSVNTWYRPIQMTIVTKDHHQISCWRPLCVSQGASLFCVLARESCRG